MAIVFAFNRVVGGAGARTMSEFSRGSIVSGTTPRGRAPAISASSGAPNPGSARRAVGGAGGGGGRVAKPLRRAGVGAGAAAGTVAGIDATGVPHLRHSVHVPGNMYPQPEQRFIAYANRHRRPATGESEGFRPGFRLRDRRSRGRVRGGAGRRGLRLPR